MSDPPTTGNSRRPKAVLIAGPTASGKSAAALALAVRFRGTVINADSMQIYRELAVLTARPGPADLAAAPHRLYGTVPAAEAYSVGRWLAEIAACLDEAERERRLPILVGGTGLYFKALTEGLAPVPDIPEEVRRFWRDKADRQGGEGLYQALAARDPAFAARLRPSDPQRVLRALEVIDATGVSLGEWRGASSAPLVASTDALKLVLAPERAPLYAAIDARLDRMLKSGALDEVRTLMTQDLDDGLPAMRAHGVRELMAYFRGEASLEQAVAKAKTETRRYAKRQMTWARRFMADWEWFPDTAAAIAAADAMLARR